LRLRGRPQRGRDLRELPAQEARAHRAAAHPDDPPRRLRPPRNLDMSLRLRLLLAVGAVALVALVASDVATYRYLRSFLYQRVDQSLESAHVGLERAANGQGSSNRGGPPGDGGRPGEDGTATRAPGTFAGARDDPDP